MVSGSSRDDGEGCSTTEIVGVAFRNWSEHGFAISRLDSPEVLLSTARPLQTEARGRPVRAAPAVLSCAISCKKHAHEHTVKRRASGLPCAMALRLYRALPGEPSSVATVASQIFPQSWRHFRAPGPHDFAVRYNHVRLRTSAVHRIPTRNVPNDRDPPLCRVRRADSHGPYLPDGKSEIFFVGGRTSLADCPSG